ncbi:MAG: iron chelate uptake ABC transporter family permease subunit [Pseudomonadales bacterium]|nr:iron chelate uptake ABC transporter family permease subunit [Pseudomonadales bacterium]
MASHRTQVDGSNVFPLSLGLTVALLLALLLSVAIGPAGIGIPGVFGVFANPTAEATILFEIRLPRALIGMLVGASLGIAGAGMQGLLRNPLAEPGVIGVSGCAGLGAVLVFYSGITNQFALGLPFGGMLGALVAVWLLYRLSGRSSSTLSLVLAGVAINAFAGALTALVLNLSSNPFAAYEIVFWLMGSFADRSLQHVSICIVPIVLGWILLTRSGKGLNALSLGEDTAVSMGINLPQLRLAVILGTALCVGAAVSVSGMIGFIGLVVPHLLRPWVGYEPGRLLLPSALGGATLALLADIAVRTIPTPIELKIGVLTALIGAPFFLSLLRSMRRELV